MAATKLRVVFFGELGSTFSRLHYAVLKKKAHVLLWVAGRNDSASNGVRRQAFLSAEDWLERFEIRSIFEWQTFKSLGIPLNLAGPSDCPIRFTSRNDANLADDLAALSPDLIVSAGFSRILPEPVLGLPRLGAFNCHPSPLPRYAGSNPWFWILRNGETESAVTIHRMIAEADAGDIVRQQRFPVSATANHQQLYNDSSLRSALLLKTCLDLWKENILGGHPQDLSKRSFFHAPNDDDYRIGWMNQVHQIQNLVRAASPSPRAWTRIRGQRFAVCSVAPVLGGAPPGTIIHAGRNGVRVACEDGAIDILVAALDGKELRGARISHVLRISEGNTLD